MHVWRVTCQHADRIRSYLRQERALDQSGDIPTETTNLFERERKIRLEMCEHPFLPETKTSQPVSQTVGWRTGGDAMGHGSGPCSRTKNTLLPSPRKISTRSPVVVPPMRPIHTAVVDATLRVRGLREALKSAHEGGNECAQ